MIKIPRLLKANEINARVQSITQNKQTKAVGAIVLLYKDARTDMELLDETYGPMNWTRYHQAIDGKLFCTISIREEDTGDWVSKQDVGVESNMDATKGEASDAFKRAGFNWGIGRELYTAPFIYIPLHEGEWYEDQGKKKASSSFRLTVKEIGYNDNREINNLVLTDSKGAVRYTLRAPAGSKQPPAPEPTPEPAQKKRSERVTGLCQHHDITYNTFTEILTDLQLDGKVANTTVNAMTDAEFVQMLGVMHETLNATKA